MPSPRTRRLYNDRRAKDRYSLSLAIRFAGLVTAPEPGAGVFVEGSGETINISSTGVLFHTSAKVPAGANIWLDLAWPMKSESPTPISLTGYGTVVRTRRTHVAVRFDRHDFKRPVVAVPAARIEELQPLVIVADTPAVYDLAVTADTQRIYPVLRTEVTGAVVRAVQNYPDALRLLIVTTGLPEFAPFAKEAFFIDTNGKDDAGSEGGDGQIVHLRRPLNPALFRQTVRSMLEKIEQRLLIRNQRCDLPANAR